MTRKKLLQAGRVLTLSVIVVAMSAPGHSAIVLADDRSNIPQTDQIVFSGLGADLATLPNPLAMTTSNGGVVTARLTGMDPFYLFLGSTFNADFLPVEFVLSNFGSSSSVIRWEFASAIAAAGAQISPSLFGNFTARMQAFDAANSSLGIVTRMGINAGNGNGSAAFIGVLSDAANVRAIEFSIVGGGDFAVNRISLSSVAIPEPQTFFLVLSASGAAALMRLRRQSRR